MSGVTFHCELDTWGWGGCKCSYRIGPRPKSEKRTQRN